MPFSLSHFLAQVIYKDRGDPKPLQEQHGRTETILDLPRLLEHLSMLAYLEDLSYLSKN